MNNNNLAKDIQLLLDELYTMSDNALNLYKL